MEDFDENSSDETSSVWTIGSVENDSNPSTSGASTSKSNPFYVPIYPAVSPRVHKSKIKKPRHNLPTVSDDEINFDEDSQPENRNEAKNRNEAENTIFNNTLETMDYEEVTRFA